VTKSIRALTRDELAAEAGAPEALIDRLLELGQIRPLPDGRFDARDAAIIATVLGLERSGVADDDLAWLVGQAGAGFAAVGPMFATPPPRDGPTYDELRAELGPSGQRLASIYAAFGLSEPEPERRLRADEASIVRRFAALWADIDPDGDADLRVARLAGDSTRRIMEGWLDVWDETVRPALATQGAPGHRGPLVDPADPDQNPSIPASALVRDLLFWLQEQHLERTLNQRIIDAVEGALVRAGRLPARPDVPTAIAFVDLTDYTSMTERLGDEAAALAAARLAELADACARAFGGRVVKLLGDGVLLRFEHPRVAIDAIVDLLREMVTAGLPPGHAGIAAGRVVTRDGDVFGRTVNLAARISGHATGGELLVEEGVVLALGADAAVPLEPVEAASLHGIGEPVALWRVAYHPR
jgi:adenylate cyclase